MAETQLENMDEPVDVVEAPVDNAKGLTSALVILTFVMILVAVVMVEMGLKKWFGAGIFA